MGHDVSFHPVDVPFIHERVLPYVMGKGSIDDLVRRAVLLEKVRARAHQWGIALMKWPRVKSLPFDPYLHLWGRPFFITGGDTWAVSRIIDQYLAAGLSKVDEIARDMFHDLSPDLPQSVAPKPDARITPDAQLENRVRWKMDLFRKAYQDLGSARKVRDPKGREHDPHDLFKASFPLAAVEFAARFLPGWMSRGTVWPTTIMEKAGLDPGAFFEPPTELFAPLIPRVPALARGLKTTIDENITLGGYVPPGKVASLREHLKENGAMLLRYAAKEMMDQAEFLVELRKIGEALGDAATRKLGFVEAAGIYSTPLGILN